MRAPRPLDHSEPVLIQRLEDAIRFMKFCVSFYQYKVTEDALRDAGGKLNTFAMQQSSSAPARRRATRLLRSLWQYSTSSQTRH